MVHEILSEALEHLFLKEYLPDIPPSFLSREEGSPHNIEYSLQENEFMQQYREQKEKASNGGFGKTPQY